MPKSRSNTQSTAETSDFDIDSQIPGAYPGPASTATSTTGPGPISTQQTLSQALHARRSEYTEPKKISIKVGSWNVAACKGTDKDIGGWFVDGRGVEEALTGLNIDGEQSDARQQDTPDERETIEEQEARRAKNQSTLPKGDRGSVPGGEDISLYVLGLQEVVDVTSPTEALRPYTDPGPSQKFKAAIEEALPLGYQLVAEQQLIGMLIVVYAHANILEDLSSVSTTSVGTGFMGYMGNKGAVTVRLMLGETTRLVFIDSHLAAGADKGSVERRNWDASEIVKRTKFEPIIDSFGVPQNKGEVIGDEDYTFWFGDLNYRLEGMPGDDIRRLLMLHTKNEYDMEQKQSADKVQAALQAESSDAGGKNSFQSAVSSFLPGVISIDDGNKIVNEEDTLHDEIDPASLQATINSLLPHDELMQQMKAGAAFQDGWREGDIRFLPTYKYDVGTVGIFDSSEKRRCPSWCDRILYRSRKTLEEYKRLAKDAKSARKSKPAESEGNNGDYDEHAEYNENDDVLFDYDPEEDGERGEPIDRDEDGGAQSAIGDIELECYVAHQRVLSSDHKPLDAVFTITYDKVLPEQKAKVHTEVARELDRAENETRPTVTVIADKHGNDDAEPSNSPTHTSNRSSLAGQASVDFGHIHENERKTRSVTVANTGQVPATLRFVDRPAVEDQPEGPFPAWLSPVWDRDADPSAPKAPKKKGMSATAMAAMQPRTLQPGDVCNFDLHIDAPGVLTFVKSLDPSCDAHRLEDILILRVENGRDHFLPVSAKWITHSLDKSLGKMKAAAANAIRKLQGQKPSGEDQDVMSTPAT